MILYSYKSWAWFRDAVTWKQFKHFISCFYDLLGSSGEMFILGIIVSNNYVVYPVPPWVTIFSSLAGGTGIIPGPVWTQGRLSSGTSSYELSLSWSVWTLIMVSSNQRVCWAPQWVPLSLCTTDWRLFQDSKQGSFCLFCISQWSLSFIAWCIMS